MHVLGCNYFLNFCLTLFPVFLLPVYFIYKCVHDCNKTDVIASVLYLRTCIAQWCSRYYNWRRGRDLSRTSLVMADPVRPPPPPRVLGSLGEFDPDKDNISSYLERVQLYFEANIVEDDWKVAVLLTLIGAKTYETLRSLLAPELPRDKPFDELLGVLRKHLDPQPLLITKRFRFYQRSQKTDESIADYIADLRQLSIKCEFGEFLDQALRDRFVCGVRTESIQKKLLTEADLTMKRAQEIAQSIESADKGAKDLKGDATHRCADSVNLTALGKKPKPCYRCN